MVTLHTGREVRFGLLPGTPPTYAPPKGENLTLLYSAAPVSWTLRDAAGYTRVFDANGRLASVADTDGRTQSYVYAGSQLSTVADDTSGRTLHITWSAGHITQVAEDPPAVGQPAPTWKYGYVGNQLTSVCTPLGDRSCAMYSYTSSSHYRSVVLDANPAAYWPLGEASGTVAANVAARSPSERDGICTSVTLARPAR